jgi:hypothetical protein
MNKMTITLSVSLAIVGLGMGGYFEPNSEIVDDPNNPLYTIPEYPAEYYPDPIQEYDPSAPIYHDDDSKFIYESIAELIFAEYGLPYGLATAMIRYESKTGELMVSKTGCKGWFQFCKKTAKQYGLKDPMNLIEASHAAARLAVDNQELLRKRKLNGTNINLYLAHMLGASGTYYVYKARAGRNLSKKQHNTLMRVLRPNWSNSMGKFKGSTKSMAVRFYSHVHDNFIRLSL